MNSGIIYVIRNNVNDKVYIGQTTSTLEERWDNHKKLSTRRIKQQYKLYKEMNEIGVDNFYIEKIEDNININELDEKEIYYIHKFDSFYNGLNSTKGGKGGSLILFCEDVKTIINRYNNGESAKDICKDYNISCTTIERVLKANGIKIRKDGRKLEDENFEYIKNLAETNTYKEVGKLLGVNEKTVRRFLNKHGFKKRSLK